jgi:Oxidoreductase family, NAD-binding Rossmann fold
MRTLRALASAAALILALAQSQPAKAADPPERIIRIGIIGCDTSHVPAFTKIFNDPKAAGDLAGFKIVAAFPGGSPDLPKDSIGRIPKFVEEIKKSGVEIVDSIPALLEKVDVVLLESVDGRPHLAQARPVIEAGKPLFIDKPLAGSLADAIAISQLAKKHNVPWFSSSSLRFGPGIQGLRKNDKVGQILGCDAYGPCPTEEHHPDLFWYGVHGVEILYTLMGAGCQSVTRSHTDGADVVVGIWEGGRIGTFRGIRKGKSDYGATAFGDKGVAASTGFGGYQPLVEQIATFFKTREPPVAAEETLELFAFMEAADESKRRGGKPVNIQDVMNKAREEAKNSLAR